MPKRSTYVSPAAAARADQRARSNARRAERALKAALRRPLYAEAWGVQDAMQSATAAHAA